MEISCRRRLKETQIGQVASVWGTDADLGRLVEQCIITLRRRVPTAANVAQQAAL